MSFNGDQLLEILSWLPAKHIYKFSSICKLSKELLSDDFFIRKQFKNMQIVGDTDFFITNSKKLELHEIYSTNASTCNLSRESLEFLVKKGNILASSNGIICGKNMINNDLFLLNPTTKSYLPIPVYHPVERKENYHHMIIFSCEEEYEDNFDYLLLILTEPIEWGGKFHSKIYSPEEKIWKDGGMIDLGVRDMFSEIPIYLNGVVYMMSDSYKYIRKGCPFYWPYVAAYDIKNSSTEFFKIPKIARQGQEKSIFGIFKWEKKRDYFKTICLAKFFNDTFYVWKLIINDRHDKSSLSYKWSQVLKMHVKDIGLECCERVKMVAFTIINGSVLLFATEEKVYRYDLARNNAKLEEICKHKYGGYVRFHSFSSTLRPCGPGAI